MTDDKCSNAELERAVRGVDTPPTRVPDNLDRLLALLDRAATSSETDSHQASVISNDVQVVLHPVRYHIHPRVSSLPRSGAPPSDVPGIRFGVSRIQP